jgi:hypothetical protein
MSRSLTFIHDISKIYHRPQLVPCQRAISIGQDFVAEFLVNMRVSGESVEDIADQDRRGLVDEKKTLRICERRASLSEGPFRAIMYSKSERSQPLLCLAFSPLALSACKSSSTLSMCLSRNAWTRLTASNQALSRWRKSSLVIWSRIRRPAIIVIISWAMLNLSGLSWEFNDSPNSKSVELSRN